MSLDNFYNFIRTINRFTNKCTLTSTHCKQRTIRLDIMLTSVFKFIIQLKNDSFSFSILFTFIHFPSFMIKNSASTTRFLLLDHQNDYTTITMLQL